MPAETEKKYVVPFTSFAAEGCKDWFDNTVALGGYGPAVATSAASLQPAQNSTLFLPEFMSGSLLPLEFAMADALGTVVARGSRESNTTDIAVSQKQGHSRILCRTITHGYMRF